MSMGGSYIGLSCLWVVHIYFYHVHGWFIYRSIMSMGGSYIGLSCPWVVHI